MGISFTRTVTCNGCNTTLELGGNWSSFLENINGINQALFSETIAVCNIACFKTFAANITTQGA